MAAATVLVFSGFALVPFIGSSLFPPAETSYFLVTVTAPEGAAITQTDRAVRYVEAALKDEPDVKAVMANVGRGNPQIFYNQRNFDQRSNLGEVLVVLDDWKGPQSEALVARLRSQARCQSGCPVRRQDLPERPADRCADPHPRRRARPDRAEAAGRRAGKDHAQGSGDPRRRQPGGGRPAAAATGAGQ